MTHRATLCFLLALPVFASGAAGVPTGSSLPLHFTALERADGTSERALFSAQTAFVRCLWRTDGTPEGTFRLEIGGECLEVDWHVDPVAAVADGVAYVLVGGSQRQVWRTDGTAAGSWPLGEPLLAPFGSLTPFELLHSPALGLVFYLADDGVHGLEPWVSDGSPGSARLLADLVGAGQPGHAANFAEVGGEVLFFVPDGEEHELWRTDGTAEGTLPVAPMADGDPETTPGRLIPVAGGAIFFVERQPACASELWRTDGTAAGTAPLAAFGEETEEACAPRRADEVWPFAEVPGDVLFAATPAGGGGSALWRTDGTPAGTVRLTGAESIFFGGGTGAEEPVRFAGRLYFQGRTAAHGAELWSSDGTAGGTGLAADLCPGPCSGRPINLHAAPEHLVFAAFDDELGWEPWTSDGTPAGTRRIGDFCAGRCSTWGTDRGFLLGETLLFGRFVAGQGHELSGLQVPDGPLFQLTASDPAPLADGIRLGQRAIFAADDGQHGLEPWITDGTPEGTRLLVDAEATPSILLTAPAELTAEPLGGGRVRLHWLDVGDEEQFGFTVVRQGTGEVVLAVSAPADATSLVIELPEGTFVVRGFSFHPAVGRSEEGNEVVVQVGACTTAGRFLCLGGGRFRVSADWRVPGAFPPQPFQGAAMPAATTIGGDDSGSLWFFTPDNVELIVKVLDGGPVNGHAWVFWGALSDVEYRLYVEDTVGGAARTYDNPPGRICGGSDTTAFPVAQSGAAAAVSAAPLVAAGAPGPAATLFAVPAGPATRFVALEAPAGRPAAAAHPSEPCVPDERTLCLLDGALAVTVDWRDQHNGGTGFGRALPFTDLSGFFWFFHPQNVELVVKALDGRTVNGKIWVFYGALSDVGYTIRVELRGSHEVRRYENPPGVICGRGDTAAF